MVSLHLKSCNRKIICSHFNKTVITHTKVKYKITKKNSCYHTPNKTIFFPDELLPSQPETDFFQVVSSIHQSKEEGKKFFRMTGGHGEVRFNRGTRLIETRLNIATPTVCLDFEGSTYPDLWPKFRKTERTKGRSKFHWSYGYNSIYIYLKTQAQTTDE